MPVRWSDLFKKLRYSYSNIFLASSWPGVAERFHQLLSSPIIKLLLLLLLSFLGLPLLIELDFIEARMAFP